jgi:hypothetical protein
MRLNAIPGFNSRFFRFEHLQSSRDPQIRVNSSVWRIWIGPPSHFVAAAVQVMMVLAAQWHGEFVADLASEGSGLREFEMVGIAWRTPTDEAGLRCHEDQVGPVANSDRLAQRRNELTSARPIFIDL